MFYTCWWARCDSSFEIQFDELFVLFLWSLKHAVFLYVSEKLSEIEVLHHKWMFQFLTKGSVLSKIITNGRKKFNSRTLIDLK